MHAATALFESLCHCAGHCRGSSVSELCRMVGYFLVSRSLCTISAVDLWICSCLMRKEPSLMTAELRDKSMRIAKIPSGVILLLRFFLYVVCVSIIAQKERYPGSQKPINTTKSHHAINLTQEIHWAGKIQEVAAASAWVRNSSKLTKIQGLYRVP